MDNYSNQIQRIKDKLLEAKKTDKELKVFGANQHKYVVKNPTTLKEVLDFEQKYSIELPNCYREFILKIGNGGIGLNNSGAGPFYGIYPLGKNVNELIFVNTDNLLKKDCVLIPKMTDEYWKSLTKEIDEHSEYMDKEYEIKLGRLWTGILPIGTQGCSYLHGIILNGKFKGRIVNIDTELQKPKFAFERNFLDWYERWLDEVISGDIMKNGPSWFGYKKGGSEEQLITSFIDSDNLDDKIDDLNGLLNKKNLKDETLNQIEKLINSNFEPKRTLIQLLCKSSYERARPFLIDLVETDLYSVLQFIYWYAKDKSIEWKGIIEDNIQNINDDETFLLCTSLLIETNTDYGKIIEKFTKNKSEKIREQAYYALGKLKNKADYLDCFILGLQDDSNLVLRSTLQALEGVNDAKLLDYYKHIEERFPVEKDFILVNLNHRLREYGLTNQTILNENAHTLNNPTDNQVKRKWYEIWK